MVLQKIQSACFRYAGIGFSKLYKRRILNPLNPLSHLKKQARVAVLSLFPWQKSVSLVRARTLITNHVIN